METPSMIMAAAAKVLRTVQSKYYKDGIELEKGAVITQKRIDQNRALYEQWNEFFISYPDIFLDLISPSDSKFHLFFYQKLMLRATLRFGRVFVVACRAFSKSFLSILALYLACIFRPGIKLFICAIYVAPPVSDCWMKTYLIAGISF